MATSTSPTATNFLLCWSREREMGGVEVAVALMLKKIKRLKKNVTQMDYCTFDLTVEISDSRHSFPPLFLPLFPLTLPLSWHSASPRSHAALYCPLQTHSACERSRIPPAHRKPKMRSLSLLISPSLCPPVVPLPRADRVDYKGVSSLIWRIMLLCGI